jgi:hypothetical protein
MSREIDRRNFSQRRTILNRDAELRSLASAVSDLSTLPESFRFLKGDVVWLDAVTAVVQRLIAEDGRDQILAKGSGS